MHCPSCLWIATSMAGGWSESVLWKRSVQNDENCSNVDNLENFDDDLCVCFFLTVARREVK